MSMEHSQAKADRQKYVDAVVLAQGDKKVLVAGPGTGKTFLFKSVLQGKKNSLTLTFVNALVEDLSLELYGLSDVKTLHGFARSQLQKIPHQTVHVFPKLAEVIKQDSGVLLGEEIDFDPLFHNRIADNRLEFYKGRRQYYNHYGFSDLIYAAVLYFEKHEDRIPQYSQIVVDEFQDFNALEVSLIDLLAKKSPILLAGDDDQALYERLKNASPVHIRERHGGKIVGYERFTLPYCSRSTRAIVDAANDVIARAKERGLLVGRIDKPYKYFCDPEKDKTSSTYPQLVYGSIYASQLPWFIQGRIAAITREVRGAFSVLVLSPTRRQSQQLYEGLKSKGFQNLHFAEKTSIAEPTLLDGLKLLLHDDKCNLGWRIVSKPLLDNESFNSLLGRTHGSGPIKNFGEIITPTLKKEVKQMLTALRRIRDSRALADQDRGGLFVHMGIPAYGAAIERLRDELEVPNRRLVDPALRKIPIVVTTIQSAKGLAADFVFITHFDDRCCVKDKVKGISDQEVCSFLVALTRARCQVYILSTDRKSTPTTLTWIAPERVMQFEPGAVTEG